MVLQPEPQQPRPLMVNTLRMLGIERMWWAAFALVCLLSRVQFPAPIPLPPLPRPPLRGSVSLIDSLLPSAAARTPRAFLR